MALLPSTTNALAPSLWAELPTQHLCSSSSAPRSSDQVGVPLNAGGTLQRHPTFGHLTACACNALERRPTGGAGGGAGAGAKAGTLAELEAADLGQEAVRVEHIVKDQLEEATEKLQLLLEHDLTNALTVSLCVMPECMYRIFH